MMVGEKKGKEKYINLDEDDGFPAIHFDARLTEYRKAVVRFRIFLEGAEPKIVLLIDGQLPSGNWKHLALSHLFFAKHDESDKKTKEDELQPLEQMALSLIVLSHVQKGWIYADELKRSLATILYKAMELYDRTMKKMKRKKELLQKHEENGDMGVGFNTSI